MAIPAILIREEPFERRREDRWRVRLGARWLDSSPAGQWLTILDLSTSGFLLKTDQLLSANSYLIVEMPGGVSKICKTVWTSGTLHGATFSEPLSEAELHDLISSSSVVWPPFDNGIRTTPSVEPAGSLSEIFDHSPIDEQGRLPFVIRLRIIVGISAALWAMIGAGVWLALE